MILSTSSVSAFTETNWAGEPFTEALIYGVPSGLSNGAPPTPTTRLTGVPSALYWPKPASNDLTPLEPDANGFVKAALNVKIKTSAEEANFLELPICILLFLVLRLTPFIQK
jgi:hypothetical protein